MRCFFQDVYKRQSLSKAELKKYSSSLWTPLYVAENEQQCVSVVSEYNKAAIDSLKQHSFNDGQEGLKNAAKCLLKMAEYDAEKYEPQLYITLYAIGKVSAFGQNDREQARASLAACRRIAEKCARPERKGAPRAEKELTVIPVSYTHLDVYKRQVHDIPCEYAGSSCGNIYHNKNGIPPFYKNADQDRRS